MEERFATEILHELKASSRRWFVAFCIMVGLEIATLISFMWYISLPVDESTTTTEQTVEGSDNTNLNLVGGDYNESDNGKNRDDETETNEEQKNQ